MNELSRHIEILLLDNDCVIVPDFGGFMAHHSPAELDKETGSFYPPQRTLGFNSQLTLNDSLLAQSYVEAYDISYPEAVLRIEEDITEIKQIIAIEGEYEFHGIGTITRNTEGVYDFVPCTAGLLTPDLYALNSFTLDEQTKASPIEETTADISASVKRGKAHTLRIAACYTARNIAAAAIILFLFVFSSIPAGVGSSKVLSCSVIDTEFITSLIKKNSLLDCLKSINSKGEKANTKLENSNVSIARTQNDTNASPAYNIVLASKVTQSGAKDFIARLNNDGLKDVKINECGSMRRVVYGAYKSKNEADAALSNLKNKNHLFKDAWVNSANK